MMILGTSSERALEFAVPFSFSVRSLKGQQTYLNGGSTNTSKVLGGERMKLAQDNTPDRISNVCGGVRV